MFREQTHREKKVTTPCYKDCNRFMEKVDGKISMETLMRGLGKKKAS